MVWVRILIATAALCAVAGVSSGQERMPAIPEFGEAATAKAPAIGGLKSAGRSVNGVPAARLERSLRAVRSAAEAPPLRGQLEQALFAKYSRSVVLIVTPTSLGSGTIIDRDGTILTNWHVVQGQKTVGVIFKPLSASASVKESDAIQARVLRVDQIADLALIKVASAPADVTIPALGDPARLAVGADVHAIGHPFGETWSYTKGIVSQIRAGYEWQTERGGIQHRADVVQTQTPINPGNSGGPLLNDAGQIVGVASFGRTEGTSINFAIASNEVRRFLNASGDRMAPSSTVASKPTPKTGECEPVELASKRSKKNDATMFLLDTNCNGKGDAVFVVLDDKSKGLLLFVDADENGKYEVVYVDEDSDLKFDIALYDTNEDGKTDLVGHDLDDDLQPGRVEIAKA
jgi:S1-C subfamily serine protease